MTLEESLSKCVDDRGIALTVVARRTGLSYMALYDSLKNKSKSREIKGKELVKLCKFLDVNPMEMDFADESGVSAQEGR